MSIYPIYAQKKVVVESEKIELFGKDNTTFTYNGQPVLSGGSVTTLAPIGSIPNVNGASINAGVLNLQPASATFGGVLTTGIQTFSGDKTFSGTIVASNLSGTNNGDVTLAAVGATPNANGASLSGQALNLQPADNTNPGVLTAVAQTIGGNKTFSGTIVASNISGSNNGDVTLAAVGATPNANGASLSGQALNLQPADKTNPGVLTAAAQTIGGNKTFSGTVIASNISGSNNGDVTLAAVGATPNANGASLSGQVLTLQPASATQPGVLTTGAQAIGGSKQFSDTVFLDQSLCFPSPNFSIQRGNTGSQLIWLKSSPSNLIIGDLAGLSVGGATAKTTICGHGGGQLISTGIENSLFGQSAGANITAANRNCAFGVNAGASASIVNNNTVVGHNACNTGGRSDNIVLGKDAGNSMGATSDQNILIGNVGAAESNTIRIGTAANQTRFFAAGISGVTVAGAVNAVINTSGQIGTVVSSKKRKRDIIDITDEYASNIYKMRAVEFKMIDDPTNERNFGVIAEETQPFFGDMILKDEKGEILAFQYHKLDGIFIKCHQMAKKDLEIEKERINQLRLDFNALSSQNAILQTQLTVTTNFLKELGLKL